MSDSISRQAALDIFDDYNVAVENGQIEAYSRDRKRLCDLPPAQPELCEDAVSREEVLNCLEWQYPDKTPRTKIMELPPVTPKQPEPHWIPVTERLPKDDTVVLVCGKSGGVYTAIHNNSKTWIRGWWKMNSKNHHCNPTAWMPLPKPWEGDAE